MATKSLVIRVEVDRALRAHDCQANRKHRIEQGHKRLKVRKGRSWDHYCVACAAKIIRRDIGELQTLASDFE